MISTKLSWIVSWVLGPISWSCRNEHPHSAQNYWGADSDSTNKREECLAWLFLYAFEDPCLTDEA